jgi:hypothetical protein
MASILLNFGARKRPAARVLAPLHGFCADCTIKNHECLHYRQIRICFFIRHGRLGECLRERLLCCRKDLRRGHAYRHRQRMSRRKVHAGSRFLRDPVFPSRGCLLRGENPLRRAVGMRSPRWKTTDATSGADSATTDPASHRGIQNARNALVVGSRVDRSAARQSVSFPRTSNR